jgi:hypothetical protein
MFVKPDTFPRVVGAGQDRLGDLGQVDLDHRGVLGVGVGG